jgi:hypothetical protein
VGQFSNLHTLLLAWPEEVRGQEVTPISLATCRTTASEAPLLDSQVDCHVMRTSDYYSNRHFSCHATCFATPSRSGNIDASLKPHLFRMTFSLKHTFAGKIHCIRSGGSY